MPAWHLNPALTNFRAAVNAAYPGRDKTSDGTIGDLAHQGTASDHNPDPDDGSVDAWDMDVQLHGANKPAPGADLEHLKTVFQAHESSRYWIHNRVIASRDTDWRRFPYTGSNPHDKHIHWNTRQSHETSTAPWVIKEDDMADTWFLVQSADKDWHNEAFVSNRIHRRQVRTKNPPLGESTFGATKRVLTDAMREAAGYDTWAPYLDEVAGPEFPTTPPAVDHTHEVGATGPAIT
jgi:hypothetical protein